jgi:hypothetical protein
MKKVVLALLIIFIYTIFKVNAQDVILKKDGDDLKSKILEVSTEYVKYKKLENLTGPDYVIAASDIFMIKYENGSKDVFEKNPTTGQIQIRHVATENGNKTPIQGKPTSSEALAHEPKPEPINDVATRSLVIKHVKDIDSGISISGTTIYVAYYDTGKSEWVVKTAVSSADGTANFKVPIDKDGATYSFLVTVSEGDIKRAMNDVDNGKRYLWRMPSDTDALELWIAGKGEHITNKKGNVQMWSK